MIRKRSQRGKARSQGKAQAKMKGAAGTVASPEVRNGTPPKTAEVLSLLETWLKDESGYDEMAWPELKKALDLERRRRGARRLFDG